MIRRVGENLAVLTDEVPAASIELERNGFAVLRGVFTDDEVAALRAELDDVFATIGPERGRNDEYRYEMLNRGPRSQEAVGNLAILAAIEPLLGDDCHVIANTAWRNPPEFAGGPWHCDAGPHVPRPKGVEWDDRIPYPVFAQRIRPTDAANQLSPEAIERAVTRRERDLVGLHEPYFYDG